MKKIVTRHDGVGKDRWIVSYADLLTLLFCFFVVMYSISSLDVSKYAELSETLEEQLTASVEQQELQSEKNEDGQFSAPRELSEFERDLIEHASEQITVLAETVEQQFDELIEQQEMQVTQHPFWLEVEFKSNLLFQSGDSQILPQAVPILRELSQEISGIDNRIQIEGFTDNRPISTQAFPSNWELSSARAASVVRLFEAEGVDPKRMASVGYGEHQPVASNSTEEGRGRNRRVVVVIMAAVNGDQRFYQLEALQTAQSLSL